MPSRREFPKRRAVNQIWNGAGEYGFAPDFVAFASGGVPDLYMNTCVGLVRKWYDAEQLRLLFADFQRSALGDTFTMLTWLGLEHSTFLKELPERPALVSLREEHARTFFSGGDETNWVWIRMQTGVAHDLEVARWQEVLGEGTGLLNPWEKQLYAALAFDPSWSIEELCVQVRKILRRFFIFKYTDVTRDKLHFEASSRWAALLRKLFPHFDLQSEDQVLLRPNAEAPVNLDGKLSQGLWGQLFNPDREVKDRLYLSQCFGKSIYSAGQTVEVERSLCTGNHQHCHLYFTRGETVPLGKDEPYVAVAAARQREANLTYYKEHENLYRHLSRQLEEQIKNALLVTQQPLPVLARNGNFVPGQVWRALTLHDDRVFGALEATTKPDFTVDMLLDASGSRVYTQEVIAAQAYALAVSLSHCGIPLQIYAFCSLRGYTVLRLFKEYQDSKHLDRIFSYFATGWNRDGLALRGAAHLQGNGGGKKLLIMLTDARPNDDVEIPHSGRVQNKAYGEAAAIADTAAEVHALRESGVQVVGLISGEVSGGLESAREIFGQDFVRVSEIEKMAGQVGKLLQRQIASM